MRCDVLGMMHLFGWNQWPVNRYKAYDCFYAAHKAGCAAATNNLAVCIWMGYGCKEHESKAKTQLKAVADLLETSPLPLRLMAMVGFQRPAPMIRF